MSIAEKLLVVSNNLATENEKIAEQASLLQQINEALEGKTGTMGGGDEYEAGYKKGEAEGYNKGVADGYGQGYGEGYEKGGEITRYMQSLQGMFRNAVFPTGYEVDLTVADASASSGDIMHFANGATGMKSFKLSFVNKGTAVAANYAFAGNINVNDILEVVDISGMGCTFSSFAGTFQNRKALRKIIGAIDLTGCVNCDSPFPNSTALEEIAFKQGTIPKNIKFNNQPNLTATSIQSVIDGLVDLTGTTAQTVTFHRDVGARLSQEQKDAITAKNWTLAY